jgi:hypothetical protein
MAQTTTQIKVDDRFYDLPRLDTIKGGDEIVLVEQVTGLEFFDWCQRADTMSDTDKPDALVLLGLVTIAVHRGNPDWTRHKVRDYMTADFDLLDLGTREPAPPGPGDNGGPPAEPPAEPRSRGASDASTTSPAAHG